MKNSEEDWFGALVLTVLLAVCASADSVRDDPYWRMRNVGLEVYGVEIDPLGSALTVDCEIRRTRPQSKAYIVGRITGQGRRQRLGAGRAVMDLTDLPDGRYRLELSAVEDGIIRQMRPTVVPFEIQRDWWDVIEALVSLLKSASTVQQEQAVRYLAVRDIEYETYLRNILAYDKHLTTLLDEAADRRRSASKLASTQANQKVIKRDANGMEVWDFSFDAASNPWWEKRTVEKELSEQVVSRLYYDGRGLWFGLATGVGRLDPETDKVRVYDPEDGLATPVTAGAKRALAGDIYVGTGKHPARYDEKTDRFVRLLMPQQGKLSIAGMEVDTEGRLWTVSTQFGGGVSCYDGSQWRHSRSAHLSGITRDPDGEIWVATGCEHEGKKWTGFSPGEVLLNVESLQEPTYSYVYADYLGRALTSERFGGRFGHISTSARWTTWTADGQVQEGDKVGGEVHYDFTNREFWVLKGDVLINDTRRKDAKVPANERWVIPWTGEDKRFTDICFVAPEKVYLGSEKGLYKYNGRRWSVLSGPKAPDPPQVPDWAVRTSRRSQAWHDGALFTRLSDRKIKIVAPFPGDNPPRGVFYEIVKKGLGNYSLVETRANGTTNEYPFKRPFGYEPDVLFADYHGRIWASGVHYVYLFDGERIRTYTSRDTEHFDNDHIYSWAADKTGRVWIGTAGGLFLFENGEFVEQPKKISGTVFSMTYDSARDELFAASSWSGFYTKDADDVWTHRRLPFSGNARHDQMVRSITVDAEGTVWLATNAGLVSFSRKDNRWIKYCNGFTQSIHLMEDGVYALSFPSLMLSKRQPPTNSPGKKTMTCNCSK